MHSHASDQAQQAQQSAQRLQQACEQANDVRTWCTLSVHEMAHCSPVCARQTFTGTHEVVLPEGTLTSSPNDVGLLLGCSMSYSAYTQNVRVQHLMASVAKR